MAAAGGWRGSRSANGRSIRRPGISIPRDLDAPAGRQGAAGLFSALLERRRARSTMWREITAMAHAAGAVVCVDGVSYAPHGFPDVRAAGRRYLSVLGLQDLWAASGAHGDASRIWPRSCPIRGISSMRRYALRSALPPPVRTMPRSRPAPALRITSMRSMPITAAAPARS